MMTEKMMNELPALLTVKEMAEVLKIGLNTAYQIIYKKSFPVLRIEHKKIRVPKCEMIKWIKWIKSYEIEKRIVLNKIYPLSRIL